MVTTQFLFFTGKGGVGKTSVACATAIHLAEEGKKIMLVSTDPASNLDDVFGATIGQEPTPISGVTNLWAINLDPVQAAKDYREKVVGGYRGILPESVIKSMEEQLSGACTVEIAAFNLFTSLLADEKTTRSYDHILFDTAPTGHTLRLLALPKAWSGFLGANTHGASCIGPLAGLEKQREQYEKAVRVLSDGSLTKLCLVTRADPSSLTEAARASQELREIGLANQELIINGILTSTTSDAAAESFRQQQRTAIEEMPSILSELPRSVVPLMAKLPVGISNLKSFTSSLGCQGQEHQEKTPPLRTDTDASSAIDIPIGLNTIVKKLGAQERGIILVMGKGGVGKTTIATALALALAEQGHPVHLSTTDPAAHIDRTLNGAEMGEDQLTVSHISPEAEVAAYRQEVMETAGQGLDEEGRELLAEDLASPCTEEIAVFRAFARTVAKVESGFVVLDTAPTGHTLLLLDATQSYHHEVERSTGDVPEEVKLLLPRLRDQSLTHVIVVTLAQTTPVLEAMRLQDDLHRAGIKPDWWVINQTWTGVNTSDSTLLSLRQSEEPWIQKVADEAAQQVVYIPWQEEPPRGRRGLLNLVK